MWARMVTQRADRAAWYARKALIAMLWLSLLALVLAGSWHLWGVFIGLHVGDC